MSIKKFSDIDKQNEGLKDKIIGGLAGLSMLISSCQSITPEEKQRLQVEIENLNKQEEAGQKMVNYYDDQNKSKLDSIQGLQSQISELEKELGILKSGKQPKYILKLHFEEHKMDPIDFDLIEFDFEIPVDKDFYNESEIGKELGEGSRFFDLFHNGNITIVDKKIM